MLNSLIDHIILCCLLESSADHWNCLLFIRMCYKVFLNQSSIIESIKYFWIDNKVFLNWIELECVIVIANSYITKYSLNCHGTVHWNFMLFKCFARKDCSQKKSRHFREFFVKKHYFSSKVFCNLLVLKMSRKLYLATPKLNET